MGKARKLAKKLWSIYNNNPDHVCCSINLPNDSLISIKVLGFSVVLTHNETGNTTEFYANCVNDPIDKIEEFIIYFL